MKVVFLPDRKEVEIEGVNTVEDLLNTLSLKKEEVLVIDRERKRILNHDNPLENIEIIEIRKVISGG